MVKKQDAIDAFEIILKYLNEDIDEDVIMKAPQMAIEALEFFTRGYKVDLLQIKPISYNGKQEEVISVKDVKITFICPHHLTLSHGVVSLSYSPKDFILGVGEIIYAIETLSAKIQLQEDLTGDILDFIKYKTKAKDIIVEISATHNCALCSNVQNNATFNTLQKIGSLF